eukprot:jgi/Mesvir1/26715/Mv20492-RA.1
MRDYHERVTNATNFNLNSMDKKLLGKITNALRGFVAMEDTDVYLGRIPPDVLMNATDDEVTVPSLGLVPDGEIVLKLSANDKNTVPEYNLVAGSADEISDDCQPAKLIYHLSQDKIPLAKFADIHKKRLDACGGAEDELYNVIAPFIKRDILAFNRMRIAILNTIASWARSEGTLQSLGGDGKTPPDDSKIMSSYLATLGIADSRVSGIPQYSCGPGYGGVFYDGDPRNPKVKARIVDPYIVAADGTLVENPRAVFGPVCQRQRATSDLLSGITTGGGGQVSNFGGHPAMSRKARINDLASKVFTAYQLQKLRAYVPNISFRVEEAKLYQHNILDTDTEMMDKLKQFVTAVYFYDILTNTMRDINERVVNSTKTSLMNTSRAEVGKIVNVLRGFVAVERSLNNPAEVPKAEINKYVYMTRIPISVLDMIEKATFRDKIPDEVEVGKPAVTKIAVKIVKGEFKAGDKDDTKVEDADAHTFRVFAPGPLSYGNPDVITVYSNEVGTVPAYNLAQTLLPNTTPIGTVGTNVSLDSLPSALIPLLFQKDFNATDVLKFAPRHISQIMALYNPKKIEVVKDVNFGGKPTIPNLLYQFIRRDLIAFNRLRSAILNHIDAWWRNAGALALVGKEENAGAPWKSYANLAVADYRVSGIPQPSCGPGTGPVFFNMDPADPDSAGKLKVVDPYIVASDGSLVENPNAVYGPVCSRSKGVRDLFSGGTGGAYPSMDGGPLPNFHGGEARRVRRRKHATNQKKKKTVRRR